MASVFIQVVSVQSKYLKDPKQMGGYYVTSNKVHIDYGILFCSII